MMQEMKTEEQNLMNKLLLKTNVLKYPGQISKGGNNAPKV